MADNEFYQVNIQYVSNVTEVRMASSAVHDYGQELEQLEKKGRQAIGFLDSLRSRLFGQLAVASLAARAVRQLAHEVKEFGEFTLEAPDFKKNTELAYEAVLGTAEKGRDTFRVLDDIARDVHLPAEQAHGLARDLMLQGLQDTAAIARVIEAEAALMRTGQIEGARKLKEIIERSIVAGHFTAGRGKGGVRALAGLGVDAALAKELASGKLTVEEGIDKLANAIEYGPIGEAARKKFGLADFATDVSNAFRTAAQSSDLTDFYTKLRSLDAQMVESAKDGGALQAAFQGVITTMGGLVTAATFAVNEINFLGHEIKDVIAADDLLSNKNNELANSFDVVKSATGTLASAGLAVVELALVGVAQTVRAAMGVIEEFGVAIGFLADVVSDPFGKDTSYATKWRAFKDATAGIYDEAARSEKALDKMGKDILYGTHQGIEGEKSLHFHAMRAGKAIDYVADASKRAKSEILGPEDLVFLPQYGAPFLDRYNEIIEAGHKGPGFANLFGSGQDPHAYYGGMDSAAIVAPIAAAGGVGGPMAPGYSGPMATSGGGKSVSITWTGNVYVNGEEPSDYHFKEIIDAALVDAIDRLRLEMGR